MTAVRSQSRSAEQSFRAERQVKALKAGEAIGVAVAGDLTERERGESREGG